MSEKSVANRDEQVVVELKLYTSENTVTGEATTKRHFDHGVAKDHCSRHAVIWDTQQ